MFKIFYFSKKNLNVKIKFRKKMFPFCVFSTIIIYRKRLRHLKSSQSHSSMIFLNYIFSSYLYLIRCKKYELLKYRCKIIFFSVQFFSNGKTLFQMYQPFLGLSAKIYFKYVFSELSGLIFSQFCISS
jgi:hypothetical protein